MCNKAVDTSPSVIQFFPECCKTQEMCDKVVDTSLPVLKFLPDWFVTK